MVKDMERQNPSPETMKSTDTDVAIEAIQKFKRMLDFPGRFGQSHEERAQEAGKYYHTHVREVFTDAVIRTAWFIIEPPDEKYFP
jgi:hypothetical protein